MRRETPAAVAVKPPPAVSVAKAPEPFDPDDVSHAEILKHAFCMWARVAPHAAVVADGFGWPLGSGPEFEPVELVKPGQPVTP